jgi:hypothetical protein
MIDDVRVLNVSADSMAARRLFYGLPWDSMVSFSALMAPPQPPGIPLYAKYYTTGDCGSLLLVGLSLSGIGSFCV